MATMLEQQATKAVLPLGYLKNARGCSLDVRFASAVFALIVKEEDDNNNMNCHIILLLQQEQEKGLISFNLSLYAWLFCAER